MNIIIQVIK